MRLLIFGPPGAGKGTQAQFISQRYSIPHISTGDIFRENIRNETPTGIAAKHYADAGELVPDELTTAMLRDRLFQNDTDNGFLLDGYPRTPAQVEALEQMLDEQHVALNAVLNMKVPDEVIVERLGLRGRSDDSVDTVLKRIRIYHETTAPIAEYYREKDLLVDITGVGSVDSIATQIITSLESKA